VLTAVLEVAIVGGGDVVATAVDVLSAELLTVVEFTDPFEPSLQAANAAIIPAATGASPHTFLMATPPFGGTSDLEASKMLRREKIA